MWQVSLSSFLPFFFLKSQNYFYEISLGLTVPRRKGRFLNTVFPNLTTCLHLLSCRLSFLRAPMRHDHRCLLSGILEAFNTLPITSLSLCPLGLAFPIIRLNCLYFHPEGKGQCVSFTISPLPPSIDYKGNQWLLNK